MTQKDSLTSKFFYEEFKKDVEKGIKGETVFFPLAGEKLGKRVAVTKSMYFLLGGMPGSGKTAFTDTVFLLDLFDWWKKNKEHTKVKPYWVYRSMERPRKYKIAKWSCYKLWKDHNILIDVPTALGWPSKSFDLTNEVKELLYSYEEYFEELFEYIEFVDGAENPYGVYKKAVEVANRKGRLEQVDEYNKVYIPNDPNEVLFHITDHIGLLKPEKDLFSDKQILDKHTANMMTLRDLYGFTVIDINQFNRNIEDTYRAVKTELTPLPSDFKGSANMFQNADVVMALFNPYKLKAYDHMGYTVPKFVSEKGHNRLRSMTILKNSYGIDDFRIAYQFIGENGVVQELPSSDKFQQDPTLYSYFTNLTV